MLFAQTFDIQYSLTAAGGLITELYRSPFCRTASAIVTTILNQVCGKLAEHLIGLLYGLLAQHRSGIQIDNIAGQCKGQPIATGDKLIRLQGNFRTVSFHQHHPFGPNLTIGMAGC